MGIPSLIYIYQLYQRYIPRIFFFLDVILAIDVWSDRRKDTKTEQ